MGVEWAPQAVWLFQSPSTRLATDRALVQSGAAPPLGPPVLPHPLAETEKSQALAEQNNASWMH